MASGLVRAAISGISERPECQVKSATIVKKAEALLTAISDPMNIDHFDTFSTRLPDC